VAVLGLAGQQRQDCVKGRGHHLAVWRLAVGLQAVSSWRACLGAADPSSARGRRKSAALAEFFFIARKMEDTAETMPCWEAPTSGSSGTLPDSPFPLMMISFLGPNNYTLRMPSRFKNRTPGFAVTRHRRKDALACIRTQAGRKVWHSIGLWESLKNHEPELPPQVWEEASPTFLGFSRAFFDFFNFGLLFLIFSPSVFITAVCQSQSQSVVVAGGLRCCLADGQEGLLLRPPPAAVLCAARA
jgi:hypothetical protein